MKKCCIGRILTLLIALILAGCAESQLSGEEQSGSLQEAAMAGEEAADGAEDEGDCAIYEVPAASAQDSLDEEQRNSIAMLNYLAVLTQEITSSHSSRLSLEDAYSSLVSNTNPEKVDGRTQEHMRTLLDTIEELRMSGEKRERLLQIYEQNQAKALKKSLPNPTGMMAMVNSKDLIRLAASVAYLATDAKSSADAYAIETEQEYLRDGWALDDAEAQRLHELRRDTFAYMIDIVRERQLPGALALSESAVQEFVFWKNSDNNYRRLQFFTAEQETYSGFGGYWLVLADCWFEAEEYGKCLAALDTYEQLQADIFRRDPELAGFLPKAIAAAADVCEESEYIARAVRYLDLLVENTSSEDWTLRFFAAETCLDLYARTGKEKYRDDAYQLVLNNVNHLVDAQRERNANYLAPVQETEIPEDADREEKKQIREYNKSLHEAKSLELPPVYEPLALNCNLLFALAREMEIGAAEQAKIEGILRGNGEPLFLCDALEFVFSFGENSAKYTAEFDGKTLCLPARCVSDATVIRVTVTENGKPAVYEDWTVKETDRSGENFDDFTATFASESIKTQPWSISSVVSVEILPEADSDAEPLTFRFRVSRYADRKLLADLVEFSAAR